MTELQNEFTFELSTPISYARDGGFSESSTLTLKAPSNKQAREGARLKQSFWRALSDRQTKNTEPSESKDESNDEIDGETIMAIIMSSNEDINKFQDDFKSLLLNGVCFIDSSIKLTVPLYDSMSDADTERLMGEYLANFLLASQIKKMQKK